MDPPPPPRHTASACLRTLLLAHTEYYNVSTFSSYTPVNQMKCPGARTSPLNPNITDDIMRRLNWMINTYFNPQVGVAPAACTLPPSAGILQAGVFYDSLVDTPPDPDTDTFGPPSGFDMQSAVWALTGLGPHGEHKLHTVCHCIDICHCCSIYVGGVMLRSLHPRKIFGTVVGSDSTCQAGMVTGVTVQVFLSHTYVPCLTGCPRTRACMIDAAAAIRHVLLTTTTASPGCHMACMPRLIITLSVSMLLHVLLVPHTHPIQATIDTSLMPTSP